jgi:hypothetical protein
MPVKILTLTDSDSSSTTATYSLPGDVQGPCYLTYTEDTGTASSTIQFGVEEGNMVTGTDALGNNLTALTADASWQLLSTPPSINLNCGSTGTWTVTLSIFH